MQKLTTLEKVSNRIDALSANCYDRNIDVPELSFDNLNAVNIAGEPHMLKPIAQRSISNRLGIRVIDVTGSIYDRLHGFNQPFEIFRLLADKHTGININV